MLVIRNGLDNLLKRHFFHALPAQDLSLFRCLFCVALLLSECASLPKYLRKFAVGQWHPVPLFEITGIPDLGYNLWLVVGGILAVALVLTAAGCWTRSAAAVAAIAYLLFKGQVLGFDKLPGSNYVPHGHNLTLVILAILAVAPGTAVWGIDRLRQRQWTWMPTDPAQAVVSAWPAQLIKLALALAYFGGGYCKISTSPLWADGYTLQSYLLQFYLRNDTELAYSLAQNYWVCLVLGVITLVLELTFFLVVFCPRLRWFYVAGGMGMHLGIYLTMGINFLFPFGLAYLIFLDWATMTALGRRLRRMIAPLRKPTARQRVPRRSKHRQQQQRQPATPCADAVKRTAARAVYSRGTGQTLGDTWAARGVLGATAGILLGSVLGRIDFWPLTDYRMFHQRMSYGDVAVIRLAGIDGSGNRSWLELGRFERKNYDKALQSALAGRDPAAAYQIVDSIVRRGSANWSRRYAQIGVFLRSIDPTSLAGSTIRLRDTQLLEVPLGEPAQGRETAD